MSRKVPAFSGITAHTKKDTLSKRWGIALPLTPPEPASTPLYAPRARRSAECNKPRVSPPAATEIPGPPALPELRPRAGTVRYFTPTRGEWPYSEMEGVQSHQLSRHVGELKKHMNVLADPADLYGRRAELAEAVADDPEIRAAAERAGRPTHAQMVVACGRAASRRALGGGQGRAV